MRKEVRMYEYDRQSYTPTTGPAPEPRHSFDGGLERPLIAVAVVALLLFGGYKFLKSTSTVPDAAASDAQVAQIVQKLDDLEQRLDQLEKKRRASKEVSESPTPGPPTVAAAVPVPPKPQLAFSRPVSARPASVSPDNSPPKLSPPVESTRQNDLNSERADTAASQQRWEATADRLGNVVGELDSQRGAIERDQARLDELAGHFAQNSQPFTLETGSTRQQVGPVWLRLQGTNPRSQRYTMRLSVDDKTIELKDRALHEAIQFYASGGKLSFELVVSQIGKDGVAGRLVLPQMTAAR
jgi:hypothetical protein